MAKIKLSKARLQELLAAERKLLELLPEYDKVEECGVDCLQFRQVTDDRLKQIAAIKKNFGA